MEVHRDASDYPARLLELPDPPQVLYLSGPLPRVSPVVAIVGSRQASEKGRRLAADMGQVLSAAGALVVSGGALGIDEAAHRGTLVGGGTGVVVLPTPLCRPSPQRNRPLFHQMVTQGGVLLSEVSPGQAIRRSHFMARNRIIAGLSDWVVVVEAQARSGTRHTIHSARRLGRRLAAVLWAPDDHRGAGLQDLLASGATILRHSNDLLEAVGLATDQSRKRSERFTEKGPAQRGKEFSDVLIEPPARPSNGDPILDAIDPEMTMDLLCHRLGLSGAMLLPHLTRLELQGEIEVRGGRIHRICCRPPAR